MNKSVQGFKLNFYIIYAKIYNICQHLNFKHIDILWINLKEILLKG